MLYTQTDSQRPKTAEIMRSFLTDSPGVGMFDVHRVTMEATCQGLLMVYSLNKRYQFYHLVYSYHLAIH